MALIKCSECNHDVSDQAARCPMCGYPIESAKDGAPVASPVQAELIVRTIGDWLRNNVPIVRAQLNAYWHAWDTGGKVLFISACLATILTLMQRGSYFVLCLFIYPTVRLLLGRAFNRILGSACALLAVVFSYLSAHSYLLLVTSFGLGYGVWVHKPNHPGENDMEYLRRLAFHAYSISLPLIRRLHARYIILSPRNKIIAIACSVALLAVSAYSMIGLSSRIFVMNKEDAFIHAVHEYAEAKAEYDADLEANRDFYREQQRQYMLSMISGADGLKNAPPKSPQLINVGDKLQKMSIALNEYTAYLDANHIPRSRLAEVIRDNNLGPLMKN